MKQEIELAIATTESVNLEKFRCETVMFGKIKKLFFVGIGGAGMCGLAEVLHNLGFQVRGSDSVRGAVTDYLSGLGIGVYDGHASDNLEDAEVVVISSAIAEDNPEVVAARRRGLPIIKRAEMLGELMRLKFSIGVAGTHGKTTTTSMIGRILQRAEFHPTIIVGGIVSELGMGAALGSGDYLVAEADEYDRSFLAMYPSLAVITNLEADHLDCYDDMDDLKKSFLSFMNRVPFYGSVVLNADDNNLATMTDSLVRPHVTFGFGANADYRATDIKTGEGRSQFVVSHHEAPLGEIKINVPGRHNIANALAAVAACRELEVPFEAIADALLKFQTVARRFELIGEANDILLFDDYAHHPTEIRATLEMVRENYNRRLIVVFQPHLYTRTRDFANEFAEALSGADICILTDIYPAREQPIEGVTSELIKELAEKKGARSFEYVGTKDHAPGHVLKITRPGDLIITMGAGSITHVTEEILKGLKKL